MSFPFNLYLIAFVSALVSGLLLVPLFRGWSYQVGLVDDPGYRKIHHKPIALAGGIAVLAAVVVPLAAGAALVLFSEALPIMKGNSNLLVYGFGERARQILVIFLGASAMVLLGWLDDKHELKPAPKFLGQLVVAFFVAGAGIRVTLFIENIFFSYLVTILWVVAVTNAFNFMDNMNGLCSGVGFITCWACAWTAAVQGQYLVGLLAFAICGGLLSFLPFNYPKASIFLGDSGSHLVGFLSAVLSILPHFYSGANQNSFAVLSPLFFLAVPLLDLAWVVALRTAMGRPFYMGDTNHFSHQLVKRGFSKSTAVALLWLLSALAAWISFQWFSN